MINDRTLETTLRMDTAVPLDTAIHEPPLATAGEVGMLVFAPETRSGESPNVRRVGHADLLREAVDGLVGEDPPQS